MLPVILLLYRNLPEDVGQQLEEAPADRSDVSGATVHRNSVAPLAGLDLRSAVRTRAYWIMITLHFVTGMVWAGTVFHLIPVFDRCGLTANQAAAILGIYAVSMAVVQPIAGLLTDLVPLNLFLSAASALVASAMAVLLSTQSM